MPNWCYNYINIECDEELMDRIHEYVSSANSDFDFEKIIPMPENIYRGDLGAREQELYGENNWYDWSIKHWGTKWNAADVYADPGEYYEFQTAWDPCEPVIAELARIFPEATFWHEYEIFDVSCGVNIYKGGILIYTMQGDYVMDWTASHPNQFDEAETEKWKIEDELYPLQEDACICEQDENGQYHYRDYRNGRLYLKIDGTYEDYSSKKEYTHEGHTLSFFERTPLDW